MSRRSTAVLHLLNRQTVPPAVRYRAVGAGTVQFSRVPLFQGAGVLPETAAVFAGQVGRGGLPVDLLELLGVCAELVPDPFLAKLCLYLLVKE